MSASTRLQTARHSAADAAQSPGGMNRRPISDGGPFSNHRATTRKGNHVNYTTIFGATIRRLSNIFNVGFWLFGLVVYNQISESTWDSKQPEQTTRNERIEGPPTGTGLVGYHMVPSALKIKTMEH